MVVASTGAHRVCRSTAARGSQAVRVSTRLQHPNLLIASRAWLCTREEFRGRSGCGETLTKIVVAAAMLGEQMLLETMSIEEGCVVVFNELMPFFGDLLAREVRDRVVSQRLTLPLPHAAGSSLARLATGAGSGGTRGLRDDVQACRADPAVRRTYDNVRNSPDVTKTQDWLEVLSGDAYELVGDRLASWNVVNRVTRGRFRVRTEYQLVDVDDVATASATLSGHVAYRRPRIPRGDALLLGLIRASKLEKHVLGPAAENATDYILGQVEGLGSWEQALITETEKFATNQALI